MKLLVCLGVLLTAVVRGFVPVQQRRLSFVKRHDSSTRLHMVFDFFKKQTDALDKLANASYKGTLGEELADAATAFATGLSKSRDRLAQNLELLLTGTSEDLLEELQDVLLQADLGSQTSEDVVSEVRSLLGKRAGMQRQDLLSIMRGKLVEILQGDHAIHFSSSSLPTVLFVMGANGMGKTTTIGKLANRLRVEGEQKVLVAACDTFRAGAVEQLQQWADRAEVECYGPSETKTTPSAVLYGALDHALANNVDTVLVDTSGRLSNNEALTQELAKMKRVIQKRLFVENDKEGKPLPNTDVPHETLLVLDAAQGRMALDSAKVWNKEIGLTGLILTKLDGSARGGSVVAISRELDLPVKLIGVGEGIHDLRDFEPEVFVDGLLGIGKAGGKSAAAANEGAILASRLTELRKDRDVRSRTSAKKAVGLPTKTSAVASVGAPATPDAAGELTFQEMEMPPPQPSAAGRSVKPNRKKKKKRKKKGKR